MKYGWIKDTKDNRDLKYKVHRHSINEVKPILPKSIDLRKSMPPVYDQGELGSCHDDKTEVLTIDGWKLFNDITPDNLLATVDPYTRELFYEKPINIIKYQYIGEMICCDRKTLNFKVTPNHKMLIRVWDEDNRTLSLNHSFVDADKLGWYCGLLTKILWQGDEVDTYIIPGVTHKHLEQRNNKIVSMKTWMKFLGMFLADGTLLQDKKDLYKIQIAASKLEKQEYFLEILLNLGLNPLQLSDRFTFSNKRIYNLLESYGLLGKKALDKFVPKFVFQQSAQNIRYFLEAFYMGDGCCQNGHVSFYTSSKTLADDLQLLVFLSGDESGLYVRPPRTSIIKGREINSLHNEHRISVCDKKSETSIDVKQDIFKEEYDGFVYCAEVPTCHTLVTRRNNKILISGNCTGNAVAGALGYLRFKDPSLEDWSPSRLYIYYHERVLEGTTEEDNGAMIRNGIKVVGKVGAPPESFWPYDLTKWKTDPPKPVDIIAHKYLAMTYYRVDWTDLEEVKGCLAAGFPIVFGFSVFSNLDRVGTGANAVLTMPTSHDKPEGGHAVLLCGYNDDKKLFLVRNSWSENWGDKGYFWMPYDYVTDPELSDDFWTIRATL